MYSTGSILLVNAGIPSAREIEFLDFSLNKVFYAVRSVIQTEKVISHV
jgi:hypothetical protein